MKLPKLTFSEYFMLAIMALGCVFYWFHAFLLGLTVNTIQVFMVWRLIRENNKLKQTKADAEKIL